MHQSDGALRTAVVEPLTAWKVDEPICARLDHDDAVERKNAALLLLPFSAGGCADKLAKALQD